ncbi:MAG: response regulator transcription factor [Prevotella sp.]|nr:response regulator transcription factor [Prevotella sp.]
MRPLTCIIIDDEPLAVKLLESFVTKTPGLELVASFTDSVEAIANVKEKAPDLLFLDIQMPDINGMELARMIPPETRIIFTTAFQEFALESYEVSALDFLLKPIRYNKFLAAVEKARTWYSHTEMTEPTTENNSTSTDTVFIKVDGEFHQIAFSNILYVAGMKDYVMFYLEGERKPLITYLRMKAVEDLLPESQFMRVHRSYIVALNKIRSVDRNDCIYIGDEIIRVTEAYREQFNNYLKSRFPG